MFSCSEDKLVEGHALHIPNVIQIFSRVSVVHVVGWYLQLVLGAKVLHVLVEGKVRGLLVKLSSNDDACFVRPSPGDVADGVAAAAQADHGNIEAFDKAHTIGVT